MQLNRLIKDISINKIKYIVLYLLSNISIKVFYLNLKEIYNNRITIIKSNNRLKNNTTNRI